MPISLSPNPHFFTLSHHNRHRHRRRGLNSPPISDNHLRFQPLFAISLPEKWEFAERVDPEEGFGFGSGMRRVEELEVEVMEIDAMKEQWRRSRLAWLCQELPAHRAAAVARILKAHRKWIRQEDATCVAVHCMRIRENDSGFLVYKWMLKQSWYQFDCALANKLADYLGKERKFSKCREIFDDIVNQGRVPSESTFHVLIVSYLSSPNTEGCLEEACSIYNRMIQTGGYRPQLTLHNSLFRALVSKPGSVSKQYLKQAEFVFHNVVTSGFKVQMDIYAGLIWLHSYQDIIDKGRIACLREEMKRAGFKEGGDVILSVLRACAKNGNVEEAERAWRKLLRAGSAIPTQAFLYKIEAYAKDGKPMKSLEIFRGMQKSGCELTYVAYSKIIKVLCKAREVEHAESIMEEFIQSGKISLLRSFTDLMNMYFDMNLHEKLALTFSQSLDKCKPDRAIYSIYLDSLVKVGNLDRAREVFYEMLKNEAIGVNPQSCNNMLSGFISSGDNFRAVRVYKLMCQKRYEVEAALMEKLDPILRSRRKRVQKPENLNLSKEQREILVGLLLGGLPVKLDRRGKNHVIKFEFNEGFGFHSSLRARVHEEFHEWIHPASKPDHDTFYTISHKCFDFYAGQFWPKGRPAIPSLIHRWLSPRSLAYWYMYVGRRAPSGDIGLRMRGDCEGAKRVVRALRASSLEFRVKRRGNVYWIGFLGSNALVFWEMIEGYVVKEMGHVFGGEEGDGFEQGSDFDEESSDYRDSDDL